MSLCVGKWHSPDFAFCISHFLLAPEGLPCLSPVSKNLPTGGGGVGKKSILFQDFTAKFPLNSMDVFSNLKGFI